MNNGVRARIAAFEKGVSNAQGSSTNDTSIDERLALGLVSNKEFAGPSASTYTVQYQAQNNAPDDQMQSLIYMIEHADELGLTDTDRNSLSEQIHRLG